MKTLNENENATSVTLSHKVNMKDRGSVTRSGNAMKSA